MPAKHAVFTEDNAKTRWCPFSRLLMTDSSGERVTASLPAFNRIAPADSRRVITPYASYCIGSACMAWRWHHTHVNNPDNPKGDLIESGDTYGSCGLAGAP